IRAERLGVTAITRQAGRVHVRFAEEAPVDPARLMALARDVRGASLSPNRVLTLPSPEGDAILGFLMRLMESGLGEACVPWGAAPSCRSIGRVSCVGGGGRKGRPYEPEPGMPRPRPLCYEPTMKLRTLILCAAAPAATLFAAELVEGIVARVNDKLITQS